MRDAFVEHAGGTWTMPSKVYLEAPPDGDFRAMPAGGGGYAVLKWVTSFPANPARALPTVTGVVLLSDAATGELRALLDAGAVTALRTGAAAVLAAETLARPTVAAAAVVGCGVNGRAVARAFLERDRDVLLYDALPQQAQLAASELGEGATVAEDLAEALASDIVVTVTPGREVLFADGALHAGPAREPHGRRRARQGRDRRGRARARAGRLRRVGAGEPQRRHLARRRAGRLRREDVVELGRVLLGLQPGRESEHEITVFDSTGLAVQDLAVAIAVYERYTTDRGTSRTSPRSSSADGDARGKPSPLRDPGRPTPIAREEFW